MNELNDVKRLADDELIRGVTRCVREDRRVSALLLAHLGELETRGLHRDLGYTSMFDYAVRALHMSDSEAALRIYAARFARKFPASLEMLSRGELHLTAMKLLHPVLTDENKELLEQARLKTKQEVQSLIAKHCPQEDVPDSIRRLPTARPLLASAANPANELLTSPCPSLFAGDATIAQRSAAAATNATLARPDAPSVALARPSLEQAHREAQSLGSNESRTDATPELQGVQSAHLVPHSLLGPQSTCASGARDRLHLASRTAASSNREPATPISEGRYKFQFTASQRVRDLVQQAQDLYRNQVPSGDIAVIFERALELLVAERKKQLFAQTNRPRRSIGKVADTMAARPKAAATARLSDATAEGKATVRTPSARGVRETPAERSASSYGAARTTLACCAGRGRTTPDSGEPAARPRVATSTSSGPNSRHIPNDIKRRVFERDQGQCRFVGLNGDRCRARDRLEYHHVHAFGFGGRATETNIVLFCRAHNQLLAERDFTREHVERCIRARQAERAHRSLGKSAALAIANAEQVTASTRASDEVPGGKEALAMNRAHPVNVESVVTRTNQHVPDLRASDAQVGTREAFAVR